MRQGKGDLDVVKGELKGRIRDVARWLLPAGREEAGLWVAPNPHEKDAAKRRQPALKLRIHGGDIGAWRDWRSGDKGDVIGLIAFVKGTDVAGALAEARDFLGIRKLSRTEREQLRTVQREAAEKADEEAERRRRQRMLDADRLFRAGGGAAPIGPAVVPLGTFGWHTGGAPHAAQLHAEAYFSARQVPLREVPNLNTYSLRFSPQTEWWRGALYESRTARGGSYRTKIDDGPLYPAVHAAMRNKMGIVTCCHVTFLDPFRPAKAPVELPKLMFGEALGAVIELSMGPAAKPFWQWAETDAPHPVVLAEGIETALAFAVTGVPARIWACGSLAGIGGAPIDHPAVSWALFARDNNDGNAQAQKQFAAALEKLEAHGKQVVVEASHVGDDFNDLAKGEE